MENTSRSSKEANEYDKASDSVLKAEVDSLNYQVKKLEEEIYAKNLQLAGQRQLVENLQDKLSRYKGTKEDSDRKIEETLVWEGKYNDVASRCKILEGLAEELRKKSESDSKIWEEELENFRKQLRKAEEENFRQKRIISEYDVVDAKLKKELSEKEKLVKALEAASKEKKSLEEVVDNSKKHIMSLTEISEKSNENEKLLEEKNKELQKTLQELWKTQQDLKTINEMLTTSEKFLQETKVNYNSILSRNLKLEEMCKGLENANNTLVAEISNLNQELSRKISEVEALSREIVRVREQDLISFSINVNVSETETTTSRDENLKDYRVKLMALEQDYQSLTDNLEDVLKDRDTLKARCKEQENQIVVISENSRNLEKFHELKINELEEDMMNAKIQYENLVKYSTDLENKIKSSSVEIRSLEEKLFKYSKEASAKDNKISLLEEDQKSFNEIISQLNKEKFNFEALCKQKESKLKNISNKLNFYESQLQEKNKELISKENELMNADRQIDLLKKKINSSSSRIKQIATEQIDSQKKKLENNESEIKMLKDMLKSMQSELKYKQQEVLKYKKSSPPKKDPLAGNSPFQHLKNKQYVPEPEIKFSPEYFKDSPFKKPAMNIFKAKSPFKLGSKKDLTGDSPSLILQHVVKGYLTSYVLCEKEKKELVKLFEDEDEDRRGVLDKSIVLEKCNDLMLDASLLGIYGTEVDYKDFLEMNYHNQLQQIHRDLDINFSQLLPGSVSVSELRMIKQSLRPLHKPIWDVIVERIGAEHPKEVDLYIVKQVLSQVSISL